MSISSPGAVMILSKVILAPGNLQNAWEWHRALWSLFPDIERQPNESSPFLYRVERVDLAKGAEVLVQSTLRPIERSKNAKVAATRMIEPRPQTHQPLRFLLTANVTKTIRDKDAPDRKIRVPLIREEEQIQWLGRKLNGAAGKISELKVQPHPPIYFRKGSRPGKIVKVSFEGMLETSDPERLKGILESGIGPAKAFGCGLLLVRRTS